MTPDETLRALAALEAGWKRDDDALTALAQRGPGEAPLPVLLAEYGEQMLQSLLILASGIADPQEAIECLRADVTARMCTVLGQTLRTWAAGADDEAAGDIARAIVSAILNFTGTQEEERMMPLLAQLRANALHSA